MAETAAAQTTETGSQQTTEQQVAGQQTEQKTEQKAEEKTQSTETSLLGADETKVEEKVEGEKKSEGETSPSVFDAEKLQLPEGFQRDDKIFPKFTEIMTNEKLSPQERGQNLMNLYAEAVAGAVKQVSDANTSAWTETKTRWEGEIKADAEVGGEKTQPTIQSINRVLAAKLGADGAKAFKEALNVTGAGSNPAIFRGMAKIAALLDEGTHVTGSPGKGKTGMADVFFPNSPDMKDS